MSKDITDILSAYADSFGIKDSPTPPGKDFIAGVIDEIDKSEAADSMDAIEADLDSSEGTGDNGGDEREAKDFESDEQDSDQDDDSEEPVEPKTPERKEEKQEPKAEQPKDEAPKNEESPKEDDPECEGCKDRDRRIANLEAKLEHVKTISMDRLSQILSLKRDLSDSELAVEQLRSRLSKGSLALTAKDEELTKLKAELARREDEESLNVPEGMTWSTYLESLERKIGAFEQFIKSDKRVAFTYHTGTVSKCRHCGHLFRNDNSEKSRLSPDMHHDGCPLKTALAR